MPRLCTNVHDLGTRPYLMHAKDHRTLWFCDPFESVVLSASLLLWNIVLLASSSLCWHLAALYITR